MSKSFLVYVFIIIIKFVILVLSSVSPHFPEQAHLFEITYKLTNDAYVFVVHHENIQFHYPIFLLPK
jgi:hypothetical protein